MDGLSQAVSRFEFTYKLLLFQSFVGVVVLSELTQVINIDTSVHKGKLTLMFSYNEENIILNLSKGNCLFDLHIPILTWENKKIVKIRNVFERKVAFCSEDRNSSFLIQKPRITSSHYKALYGTFYIKTDRLVEVKPCFNCKNSVKLKQSGNPHIFTESTIEKQNFDNDADSDTAEIFLQGNNERNNFIQEGNWKLNHTNKSEGLSFLFDNKQNNQIENSRHPISAQKKRFPGTASGARDHVIMNQQTDAMQSDSAVLSQQFPERIEDESSVLRNTQSQQIYDTPQSDWSPYGLPLPKPRTQGGKLNYIVQML